jgi:hypothetical protein
MDIIHELTEAECEAVAGGSRNLAHLGQGDGGGVFVGFFNHMSAEGPGSVLHNGPLVSFEVHAVQSGATSFSPEVSFLWEVPFTP